MPPNILDPGLVFDVFADNSIFLWKAPIKDLDFPIGETSSECLGRLHVADNRGDGAF
jgi:hypothetical protein